MHLMQSLGAFCLTPRRQGIFKAFDGQDLSKRLAMDGKAHLSTPILNIRQATSFLFSEEPDFVTWVQSTLRDLSMLSCVILQRLKTGD